jgi:hypothetical protein
MRFRIEQQIRGPLGAIERALFDPAFIAATAALPKIGGTELLTQQRDGDRIHQRTRYRFTGDLSPAVTAVIDRDRLTWVDDAHHDLSTHVGHHRIEPDHYADRLQATYDVRLEPMAQETHRVATGELTVRVPLVGGRVERAIVSGLEEHAAAEAEQLALWIAAHRGG